MSEVRGTNANGAVEIDDRLMRQAMRCSGSTTKKRRCPRRTGWTAPTARSPPSRSSVRRPPTWWWSGEGSPACGRPSWPRRPIPTATSCSSRPTASATRPPDATAASSPPRSPTAWATGPPGSPRSSTGSKPSGSTTTGPSGTSSSAGASTAACGRAASMAVAVGTTSWRAGAAAVAHGHQASCWTGTRCGPSSIRRRSSAGCGTHRGGAGRPGTAGLGPGRVALDLGVRLHEGTPATGIADDGAALRHHRRRRVSARRALLATNAFRSLVRASAATPCPSTTTC